MEELFWQIIESIQQWAVAQCDGWSSPLCSAEGTEMMIVVFVVYPLLCVVMLAIFGAVVAALTRARRAHTHQPGLASALFFPRKRRRS